MEMFRYHKISSLPILSLEDIRISIQDIRVIQEIDEDEKSLVDKSQFVPVAQAVRGLYARGLADENGKLQQVGSFDSDFKDGFTGDLPASRRRGDLAEVYSDFQLSLNQIKDADRKAIAEKRLQETLKAEMKRIQDETFGNNSVSK